MSARTVNQHLAAIHSFARFVGEYGPEHLEWSGRVVAIPFRKFAHPEIPYLEKPEMDALLAAADLRAAQGTRDHALLMFLYSTGARATEVAQVKVEDLQLQSRDRNCNAFVRLLGKGNKVWLCPFWQQTAAEISALTAGRPAGQSVFLN